MSYSPGCGHDTSYLVHIIAANGAKMFQRQCQKCGELGEWIPHRHLTEEQKESAGCREDIKGFVYQAKMDMLAEQKEEARKERKKEYADYLNTDGWRRRRNERMELNRELFNGECECCRKRPAAECHHLTYARKYNEHPFDLACLCRECHQSYHDIEGHEEKED